MQYEKTIKDHRGRVKIYVNLVTFSFGMTDKDGNDFRYDVRVTVVAPRKRIEIYNNNIATNREILEAVLECWNKIKPTFDTLNLKP